jgi:hypothetical protein
MVAQAAQVANDEGLGKIYKNPPFSLDLSRLYAKIVRVKIGRTEADGGGMKTGSPSVADCPPSVLSAAGPAKVEGPEDLTQRREGAARQSRNQRHGTTDFSRVGGVRIAAPPLVEPDVRLFRIRLSCSLSPLAFTG